MCFQAERRYGLYGIACLPLHLNRHDGETRRGLYLGEEVDKDVA